MRVFVADFLAWNLSAGLSSESKVVEVEVDVEKERERERGYIPPTRVLRQLDDRHTDGGGV